MEYKLKKDRIAVCEIAFDSFTELPIESDLLLPDYCPDIVKVLKCQASSCLFQNRSQWGQMSFGRRYRDYRLLYWRGWAAADQ